MKRDFRDAVFSVVHDLMRADPNVVVLTNDTAAFVLDKIREELPARVVNVGVAEQNMFSLAGGLASSGKKVFCYGQCAHLMRGWEQIKVGICIPNFPVTILGLGAGLSMGRDGPTHHATEDVGLMRALANMTIYNPADCVCAEACVRMAYEAGTPHYIRLDKEGVENISLLPSHTFLDGYRMFLTGRHPMIIATGIKTQRAIDAGHQVIDVYRLKPTPNIPPPLLEYCQVWEEHRSGGLFSIVAELLCELPREMLPDKFLGTVERDAWI